MSANVARGASSAAGTKQMSWSVQGKEPVASNWWQFRFTINARQLGISLEQEKDVSNVIFFLKSNSALCCLEAYRNL
jgi:hypothetical protein